MSKRFSNPVSLMALALASVAALALGAAGCGDDGGDSSCFNYSDFNKTSPAVTFSADVLPIFRGSCGLSTACHQSQSAPPGQPYLGPANGPDATQAQIDAIFAQNVDVASSRASGMKIVDPGKPEASFLMHKVDGTLSCADVQCDSPSGCGSAMPTTGPLEQAQKDTIRRWIAQGAKKD